MVDTVEFLAVNERREKVQVARRLRTLPLKALQDFEDPFRWGCGFLLTAARAADALTLKVAVFARGIVRSLVR